jgi:hypothetical protein
MASPEDALISLVSEKFSPLHKGDTTLTLSNFKDLEDLPLSPGMMITLSGYVTHVSPKRGADADIHFNLSATPDDVTNFVVCEIQNADENLHGIPLLDAKANQQKVTTIGVLRIYLEHIYNQPRQPSTPHIFECHPTKAVMIEGNPLPNITIDVPDKDDYQSNDSMYEMQLQSNGNPLFRKTTEDRFKPARGDSLNVVFDGTDLTFQNPHEIGHNYVFMNSRFTKIIDGPFPDGDPYPFRLRSINDDNIAIDAIAIPDTLAYRTAQDLHGNNQSSDEVITAAGLRHLNIPQLMQSNYQNYLLVYRLDRNNAA